MSITSDHTYAGQTTKGGFLRRGWRKMTWALIAWSALVVIGALALSGHTASKLSSQCNNQYGAESLCKQVGAQTAGNQFEHIMKIGLVGFAVLAVIWFMTRPGEKREADRPADEHHAVTQIQPTVASPAPRIDAQPVATPQRRPSSHLPLVVLGLLAAAGIAVGSLAAAGIFSHSAPTRIVRVSSAHTQSSQTPASSQVPATPAPAQSAASSQVPATPAPTQPATSQPAQTAYSSPVSGTTGCGGDLSVGPNTSCGFAANVERAYDETGGGYQVVTAYSPATGETYTIDCSAGMPHVCSGGSTDNASVYFTSGSAPAAVATGAGSGSAACDQNISVNSVTSCPFAANVFQSYAEEYQANGAQSLTMVRAYSPVTHLTYNMSCASNGVTVTCTGGKNSFVSFPLDSIDY